MFLEEPHVFIEVKLHTRRAACSKNSLMYLLKLNYILEELQVLRGWMDELGFYVPSTAFQSFRDDGRVNMKGSVH